MNLEYGGHQVNALLIRILKVNNLMEENGHSTQSLCLIHREDRIKGNIFAYFSTNLSLVTKL